MGGRILTAQRRAITLGKIRTGWSVPHKDPGKRPVPVKSKTWVLTSHTDEKLHVAAELWGGKVTRWQPQGNGPEQWRLITNAAQIDALLPPGDPLSQYNELWSKGGCQRRCNGETELISRKPCICAAECGEDWHLQPKGTVCSATTRISVVLPDVPGLGTWMCETHSFYAASEMAGTVDMVLAGTGGRGLVPVTMRIEPRMRVANGLTKHFPVVVVEVRGLTPRQALSGPIPTEVALNPSAAPRLALEAARPDYLAMAAAALHVEDVQDTWRLADRNRHLTPELKELLKLRAAEVKAESKRPGTPVTEEPVPDADGAIDAEIVDDEWPTEEPEGAE